jgi:2,3-bisphosphoglycerate-dependent phosphoglycerate mutase
MKTIYFVRHGESEANAGAPTYLGEASKLTARGREQAQFIAERCKHLSIEALITSTAVRAKETAAAIGAKINKEPEVESLFTERKQPQEIIGKSVTDAVASKMERDWIKSFFSDDIRVGTGENFSDLKNRAVAALKYLETRKETRLLVVSHGFFLHMAAAIVLLGESLTSHEFSRLAQHIWADNTGLFLIEYRDEAFTSVHQMEYSGWILRIWNDHAHLG